jgi:transposase
VRGGDNRTGELFSYVDLEARVRRDHPLRTIRTIVNEALSMLEREFAALYSPIGRPSIPPEKLLRAMLLQAFYSIRSERLLMERLEYDVLFRWFVGIGVDDAAWDHSVFSKNRDRLLEGDIAAKFLAAVLAQPKVKKLLSSDHFSVDGTLIEAWASMKSVKVKDSSGGPPASGGRNAEADFHGQKRSNATHAAPRWSRRPPVAASGASPSGRFLSVCARGSLLLIGVQRTPLGLALRDQAGDRFESPPVADQPLDSAVTLYLLVDRDASIAHDAAALSVKGRTAGACALFRRGFDVPLRQVAHPTML